MKNVATRKALAETIVGLRDMIPENESKFGSEFFGKEMSLDHLEWMLGHTLENIDTWPIDKSGRWIGFVQGVLACHDILDVKAERDRTRPLFHAAYQADGKDIPETAERP